MIGQTSGAGLGLKSYPSPNTRAFQFQFDLEVIKVSLAISFPCLLNVSWKQGMNRIGTRKAAPLISYEAVFNERLSMQSTIYFDQPSQKYLRKNSKLGHSVVGLVRFNLTRLVESRFSYPGEGWEEKLPLDKCTDPSAYLHVKIRVNILKERIQPSFAQISQRNAKIKQEFRWDQLIAKQQYNRITEETKETDLSNSSQQDIHPTKSSQKQQQQQYHHQQHPLYPKENGQSKQNHSSNSRIPSISLLSQRKIATATRIIKSTSTLTPIELRSPLFKQSAVSATSANTSKDSSSSSTLYNTLLPPAMSQNPKLDSKKGIESAAIATAAATTTATSQFNRSISQNSNDCGGYVICNISSISFQVNPQSGIVTPNQNSSFNSSIPIIEQQQYSQLYSGNNEKFDSTAGNSFETDINKSNNQFNTSTASQNKQVSHYPISQQLQQQQQQQQQQQPQQQKLPQQLHTRFHSTGIDARILLLKDPNIKQEQQQQEIQLSQNNQISSSPRNMETFSSPQFNETSMKYKNSIDSQTLLSSDHFSRKRRQYEQEQQHQHSLEQIQDKEDSHQPDKQSREFAGQSSHSSKQSLHSQQELNQFNNYQQSELRSAPVESTAQFQSNPIKSNIYSGLTFSFKGGIQQNSQLQLQQVPKSLNRSSQIQHVRQPKLRSKRINQEGLTSFVEPPLYTSKLPNNALNQLLTINVNSVNVRSNNSNNSNNHFESQQTEYIFNSNSFKQIMHSSPPEPSIGSHSEYPSHHRIPTTVVVSTSSAIPNGDTATVPAATAAATLSVEQTSSNQQSLQEEIQELYLQLTEAFKELENQLQRESDLHVEIQELNNANAELSRNAVESESRIIALEAELIKAERTAEKDMREIKLRTEKQEEYLVQQIVAIQELNEILNRRDSIIDHQRSLIEKQDNAMHQLKQQIRFFESTLLQANVRFQQMHYREMQERKNEQSSQFSGSKHTDEMELISSILLTPLLKDQYINLAARYLENDKSNINNNNNTLNYQNQQQSSSNNVEQSERKYPESFDVVIEEVIEERESSSIIDTNHHDYNNRSFPEVIPNRSDSKQLSDNQLEQNEHNDLERVNSNVMKSKQKNQGGQVIPQDHKSETDTEIAQFTPSLSCSIVYADTENNNNNNNKNEGEGEEDANDQENLKIIESERSSNEEIRVHSDEQEEEEDKQVPSILDLSTHEQQQLNRSSSQNKHRDVQSETNLNSSKNNASNKSNISRNVAEQSQENLSSCSLDESQKQISVESPKQSENQIESPAGDANANSQNLASEIMITTSLENVIISNNANRVNSEQDLKSHASSLGDSFNLDERVPSIPLSEISNELKIRDLIQNPALLISVLSRYKNELERLQAALDFAISEHIDCEESLARVQLAATEEVRTLNEKHEKQYEWYKAVKLNLEAQLASESSIHAAEIKQLRDRLETVSAANLELLVTAKDKVKLISAENQTLVTQLESVRLSQSQQIGKIKDKIRRLSNAGNQRNSVHLQSNIGVKSSFGMRRSSQNEEEEDGYSSSNTSQNSSQNNGIIDNNNSSNSFQTSTFINNDKQSKNYTSVVQKQPEKSVQSSESMIKQLIGDNSKSMEQEGTGSNEKSDEELSLEQMQRKRWRTRLGQIDLLGQPVISRSSVDEPQSLADLQLRQVISEFDKISKSVDSRRQSRLQSNSNTNGSKITGNNNPLASIFWSQKKNNKAFDFVKEHSFQESQEYLQPDSIVNNQDNDNSESSNNEKNNNEQISNKDQLEANIQVESEIEENKEKSEQSSDRNSQVGINEKSNSKEVDIFKRIQMSNSTIKSIQQSQNSPVGFNSEDFIAYNMNESSNDSEYQNKSQFFVNSRKTKSIFVKETENSGDKQSETELNEEQPCSLSQILVKLDSRLKSSQLAGKSSIALAKHTSSAAQESADYKNPFQQKSTQNSSQVRMNKMSGLAAKEGKKFEFNDFQNQIFSSSNQSIVSQANPFEGNSETASVKQKGAAGQNVKRTPEMLASTLVNSRERDLEIESKRLSLENEKLRQTNAGLLKQFEKQSIINEKKSQAAVAAGKESEFFSKTTFTDHSEESNRVAQEQSEGNSDSFSVGSQTAEILKELKSEVVAIKNAKEVRRSNEKQAMRESKQKPSDIFNVALQFGGQDLMRQLSKF